MYVLISYIYCIYTAQLCRFLMQNASIILFSTNINIRKSVKISEVFDISNVSNTNVSKLREISFIDGDDRSFSSTC